MERQTDEKSDQGSKRAAIKKAALWVLAAGLLAILGARGSAAMPLSHAWAAAQPDSNETKDSSPHPANVDSAAPKQVSAPTGNVPSGAGSATAINEISKPQSTKEPSKTDENAKPQEEGVTADGRVILNTATEADLRKLPGIGKNKAKAIVEQRTKMGRFKRIEDLLRVKGIGPRRLSAIRTKVVLDPL
ncbi:MAG: helix-hairpin-helix domain-containing protein [Polyangiaceae bacterium]|nr:helix-hairpin-helix domain-containing protein [Polyangiaceae bacterium]